MNMRKRFLQVIGLLGIATGVAQAAPVTTLSVSPTSGSAPLSVTLTWSSTGATGCTALDGWTGVKALSGSQVITGVSATTTYTLTCSVAGGTATVSWSAPTQNTDGSALTNLAGFRLFWATSSAGVATATPVTIASPTTLSYAVANLAGGTWYFGATAYNTLGAESAMSTLASKAIAPASDTKSVTVTVNTVPKPPVLVTIAQTAYEINTAGWGTRLGRNVGTAPLGTPCSGTPVVSTSGGTFYAIPLSAVTLTRTPKSATVVAQCAIA